MRRTVIQFLPKSIRCPEAHSTDMQICLLYTSNNVKNILRQYGFPDKERVFQVGTSMEYEQIFKRIIIELQRCQDNYEEMLVLLLRHLPVSYTHLIQTNVCNRITRIFQTMACIVQPCIVKILIKVSMESFGKESG